MFDPDCVPADLRISVVYASDRRVHGVDTVTAAGRRGPSYGLRRGAAMTVCREGALIVVRSPSPFPALDGYLADLRLAGAFIRNRLRGSLVRILANHGATRLAAV